jgi:hypothetical protein
MRFDAVSIGYDEDVIVEVTPMRHPGLERDGCLFVIIRAW